ncbi:MAG: hypothetical protein DRG50_07440, partial [Deltaproteobacteria bacterium]
VKGLEPSLGILTDHLWIAMAHKALLVLIYFGMEVTAGDQHKSDQYCHHHGSFCVTSKYLELPYPFTKIFS